MVDRKPEYAPTVEEWEDDYNGRQGGNPPEATDYDTSNYEAPDEDALRTFGGLWD